MNSYRSTGSERITDGRAEPTRPDQTRPGRDGSGSITNRTLGGVMLQPPTRLMMQQPASAQPRNDTPALFVAQVQAHPRSARHGAKKEVLPVPRPQARGASLGMPSGCLSSTKGKATPLPLLLFRSLYSQTQTRTGLHLLSPYSVPCSASCSLSPHLPSGAAKAACSRTAPGATQAPHLSHPNLGNPMPGEPLGPSHRLIYEYR